MVGSCVNSASRASIDWMSGEDGYLKTELKELETLLRSLNLGFSRGVGRGRALRARAPPSSAEATHRSPTFSGLCNFEPGLLV